MRRPLLPDRSAFLIKEVQLGRPGPVYHTVGDFLHGEHFASRPLKYSQQAPLLSFAASALGRREPRVFSRYHPFRREAAEQETILCRA